MLSLWSTLILSQVSAYFVRSFFKCSWFFYISVEQTRPNYRVLATDYDNFAIVYDCVDFLGLAKAESLWFLTREEFPDQNLVDEGFK